MMVTAKNRLARASKETESSRGGETTQVVLTSVGKNISPSSIREWTGSPTTHSQRSEFQLPEVVYQTLEAQSKKVGLLCFFAAEKDLKNVPGQGQGSAAAELYSGTVYSMDAIAIA